MDVLFLGSLKCKKRLGCQEALKRNRPKKSCLQICQLGMQHALVI